MLCECQQREATIHEVVIHNGQKVERHLCEQCAASEGLGPSPQVPISQLISKYITGGSMEIPKVGSKDAKRAGDRVAGPGACPECSTTFAQFKKHGLLGCPACYEHFDARLGPLVSRAHEGAERHIGKVPQRSLSEIMSNPDPERVERVLGSMSETRKKLESVRERLSKAVDQEDYEQAAMLRDEMTRIASMPGASVETKDAAGAPTGHGSGAQRGDA